MVIAPANTGKERIKRKDVISIAQANKFNLEYVKPGALMLKIVTMKFKEPKIDETPVKCKAKIAQSTEPLGENVVDSGGYTVHPVPAPISVIKLKER